MRLSKIFKLKRNFTIALLCLLGCGRAFALDVVYPKSDNVVIDSERTFFAGSSDKKIPLTINGEEVLVDKSGGFAKSVKLEEGKNFFELKSGNKLLNYTITRPKQSEKPTDKNELIQYENLKFGSIIKDKTPLRITPIDGGINRMAHFQQGIPLIISGEQNDFYQVVLGKENFAWVAKNSVEISHPEKSELVKYYGYDYIDTDDFFNFVFHLESKTPWSIYEGENQTLRINLYNVSEHDDNIFTFEFPTKLATKNRNLIGYDAKFIGNDFVVKIRKPTNISPQKPLKNITITIDAGHGGEELGAIGCLGNKEKDLNLSVAKQLEKILKSKGAKVVMTRSDDSEVSLEKRVTISDESDSAVFISLHGNSVPDSGSPETSRGFEVYYYYPQAKPLGEYILRSMQSKLPLNNNGLKQASFYVVRNTAAISLLIEVGYLINPEDNAKLINKKIQKQIAKSIAQGLEEYFRTQTKN